MHTRTKCPRTHAYDTLQTSHDASAFRAALFVHAALSAAGLPDVGALTSAELADLCAQPATAALTTVNGKLPEAYRVQDFVEVGADAPPRAEDIAAIGELLDAAIRAG